MVLGEFESMTDLEPYMFFPKSFFKSEKYKNMSSDAKVLYTVLFDRAKLSYKNMLLDSKGRIYVYMKINTAAEILGCGRSKAGAIFKELEEYGLLKREKRFGTCDRISVEVLDQYKNY